MNVDVPYFRTIYYHFFSIIQFWTLLFYFIYSMYIVFDECHIAIWHVAYEHRSGFHFDVWMCVYVRPLVSQNVCVCARNQVFYRYRWPFQIQLHSRPSPAVMMNPLYWRWLIVPDSQTISCLFYSPFHNVIGGSVCITRFSPLCDNTFIVQ